MSETSYRPKASHDTVLAYTDSAAISGVINATKVRLFSTTDCHVKFGAASADATVSNMPLAAGVAEYFDFVPGERISAIRSASDGNLHISIMEKKTA